MKVKLFFSTWNNPPRINKTLKSLFDSNIDFSLLEVFIINNHSNFTLDPAYVSQVKIIHNETRPDWSTGHLARSWNQCLLHGFKDLSNPDADIVVACQDDTLFKENWLSKLIELHKTFEFIQNGHGDCFCSYTPEHIKKVGIWDERFCGINRQAADYFTRCLIYNPHKISLNDPRHKRVYNTIHPNVSQASSWLVESDNRHIFNDSTYPNTLFGTDTIAKELIIKKYGYAVHELSINTIGKLPPHTLIENYITYPYFEKNIYNLKEKNYLV